MLAGVRDYTMVLKKVLLLSMLFSIAAGVGYGAENAPKLKGTGESEAWKKKYPLHAIAVSDKANERKIIEIEVEGKKFSDTDDRGNIPLHYVATNLNEECVDLVLEWTYKESEELFNKKNSDGDTPLHIAARVGNDYAIGKFVGYSAANWFEQNNKGNTPLHDALTGPTEGAFKSIASKISGQKYSKKQIDCKNSDDDTLLHVAAGVGNIFAVEWLLRRGANLLLQNKKGNNPYHEAILHNRRGVAEFLYNEQENLNLPSSAFLENENRDTPLYLAVEGGAKDTVSFLLETGLSPVGLFHEKSGKNPLHLAIEELRPEILDLFLGWMEKKKIPITEKILQASRMVEGKLVKGGDGKVVFEYIKFDNVDKDKNNILHLAAKNNNWRVVDMAIKLEEKMHLIHKANKAGEGPLHVAVRHGAYHSASLFLKAGINPNMVLEATKETPLHLAVENFNYEMVDLLLRHGANRMAKDMWERTPLDVLSSLLTHGYLYEDKKYTKEQQEAIKKIYKRLKKSLWERFTDLVKDLFKKKKKT